MLAIGNNAVELAGGHLIGIQQQADKLSGLRKAYSRRIRSEGSECNMKQPDLLRVLQVVSTRAAGLTSLCFVLSLSR